MPEAAQEAAQTNEREAEEAERMRAHVEAVTADICAQIGRFDQDYKPPVITPPFGKWTREEILAECNFSMDEVPWE